MGKRKPAAREPESANGVVIAGPNPGTVNARFMSSITGLLLHDANNNQYITKHGGTIWLESSPRIFQARCDIVKVFLEKYPDADWLLFIDSDMKFESDVVDKAIGIVSRSKEDIKILGGLCFGGGRSKAVWPTLFTIANAKDFDVSKPIEIERHYAYEENALLKVNATGAAFLMIHRHVLECIEEKHSMRNGYPNPYIWFREYEQAGVAFGEDIFFCLLAGSLGFGTYVHTGLKIGHIKTHEINEEYYQKHINEIMHHNLQEAK